MTIITVSPGSAPTGTVPGQVTGLAVGIPTVSTVPVTYAAPSTGTAPFTYSADTAPHGGAVWTPNGGAFGAAGGTLTGLAAGTNYDIRITVTNAYGSSTTVYSAGVTTATPVVSVSGSANRFDAIASNSVTTASTPVLITLTPNGTWPSSATITPASSNSGTFSPSSIALSGGSAAFTLHYTPSAAGEHNISFTAPSGLFAPYHVPLNVFSLSSGTAQTLSASMALGDQAVHQRDTPSGSPVGFNIPNTNGWGEVWISITAIGGATDGLFARIYDAQSGGASATLGSGTELTTGWAQVYGPISTTGTVRLLLPAVRAKLLYLDLATNSSGTNAIRIANRFKVGTNIAVATRSQITGWFRGYAEGGTVLPTVTWQQAAVAFAADYRYGDSGTWYRIDGGQGDPSGYNSKVYGEPCSNATMEAGRLVDTRLGTMLGVVGVGATSGGLDEFVNANGSMSSAFTSTVSAACRSKFRYLIIAATAMDNSVETVAGDKATYDAAVAALPVAYPACAVIGWNTGATGVFGSDGSRTLGYTRNSQYFANNVEPVNSMVVALEDHNWNAFYSGHATQAARLHYVREQLRMLLSLELSGWGGFQTANRGPTLATSGTVATGTNVIKIGYKLNGSATLSGSTITFTSETAYTLALGGASATDLASLFAVYNSGGYNGNGLPINVASVAINTVTPPAGYDGTINITLAGTAGTVTYSNNTTGSQPTALTVQALADFGASGGTGTVTNKATVLHGDYDPLSVGIGAHMRPQLDISIGTV